MTTRCLVLDLGAGSGRAMVATMEAGRLHLTEIHRFDGYASGSGDDPRWDVDCLLAGVEEGLRRAGPVASVGIDSWGLDYALLDGDGGLVEAPHHYRHPRSQRGRDAVSPADEDAIAAGGAQDLVVSTVFQLLDESRHHPERHRRATRLLMMADFVAHHLTGTARSEATLARTSGLLAAGRDAWDTDLCRRLGLPVHLLAEIVTAGTVLGRLRARFGCGEPPVIAVRAHDTASAVAGLPLRPGDGFAICGSWSLVGTELDPDRLPPTRRLREAGFGIEGDRAHPYAVRSLNGLHLLRRLRDSWAARTGAAVDFATIAGAAAAVENPDAVPAIDPADPAFFNPPDYVGAVEGFCGAGAWSLGALALATYKGLAGDIARAVSALAAAAGPVGTLWLCGGGARDAMLRRMLAAATGCRLRLGPVEASAWGNALVQLAALGAIADLREGRRRIEQALAIGDPVRDAGDRTQTQNPRPGAARPQGRGG